MEKDPIYLLLAYRKNKHEADERLNEGDAHPRKEELL